MKTIQLTAALFFVGVVAASATLDVSSDGSDGELNPTETNKVIDLGLATSGTWNQNNNGNPGNGVYDRDKRAIIFKYTSVTIGSNKTVSFKNHPTRVPVVWLVSGSVTITGTLALNGVHTSGTYYGEPGPGGFRGGNLNWASVGLGIGGGPALNNGKFSTAIYGNPSCVPLIGGSGGGGRTNWSGGGGGGGAILIAAGETITLNGVIQSNSSSGHAVGSSGAIRLVADRLTGSGSISAYLDGRIRLEANTVTGTFFTNPQTAPVLPTVPPTLWPSEDNRYPVVKIVSIDGVSAPPYATDANMDNQADVDITKPNNQASVIRVRTQRLSTTGGIVKVRAAGKESSTAILSPAATFVGSDQFGDNWEVSVVLPAGFACLQAIATHTPAP